MLSTLLQTCTYDVGMYSCTHDVGTAALRSSNVLHSTDTSLITLICLKNDIDAGYSVFAVLYGPLVPFYSLFAMISSDSMIIVYCSDYQLEDTRE